VAPSNRITIGCIGVGGRGGANMSAFLSMPDVHVVAVCDVDTNHRERARQHVNEKYGNQDCYSCNDFREIIGRDDIDAVSIGTPDHWHAVMTVAVAKTGKDIYCEKPLSLTVTEGVAMCEAVRRYGRVLQAGTWRRSRPACRLACELVRNGRIGELRTIKIGVPKGYNIEGGPAMASPTPRPVPEGFDYDLWLGPAPWSPYTPGRCHFNFRWIMDYSEGYISDWGAHYYDVGQWGNGTDRTGPASVEGRGVFPKDGLYDAPIEHEIVFTYRNGVKMVSMATEKSSAYGMRFEGTEGWLYVESESITSEPASVATSRIRPDEIHLYRSDNHYRDFVVCVRTRQEPAAPVDIAHRSAELCHIGAISVLLGRGLEWDPDAESFLDDAEANRLLSRPMRAPWRV
jgi:predicted dehydrogenase